MNKVNRSKQKVITINESLTVTIMIKTTISHWCRWSWITCTCIKTG